MKALVVASDCPGRISGHARALACALEAYEEQFEAVHYVVLLDVPVDRTLLKRFRRTTFHSMQIRRRPLWARFLSSLHKHGPACIAQYHTSQSQGKVTKLLSKIGRQAAPHVVILEHVSAASLLPTIRRAFPSAKYVLRSHDVLHEAFAGLACSSSMLLRAAWRLEIERIKDLEATVVRECHVVWCITEDDAVQYARCFARRVDGVLSVYVDPAEFRAVHLGDARTVLHVGGLDARRSLGMHAFIREAWPIVRAGIPNARLILGGAGSDKLRNPNLGIEGLGYVADETTVMSRGNIVVNPQLSGSGIKIKSLNALAAGKLLITTPIGAQGIGFQDRVHFLCGSNMRELADCIILAIRNEELSREIATRGRSWITTHFSKGSFLQRASALITEALQSPT